jgi:hypothetical protein
MCSRLRCLSWPSRKAIIFLVVGLAICVAALHGDDCFARCTVSGRVVDGDTGAPIAYANIVVLGTQAGTITDSTGAYMIPEVEAGVRVIGVSAECYGICADTLTLADSDTWVVDFSLCLEPPRPNEIHIRIIDRLAGHEGPDWEEVVCPPLTDVNCRQGSNARRADIARKKSASEVPSTTNSP